MKARD